MRRFISTGAKAIVSSNATRRGFHSVQSVVTRVNSRSIPMYRFNSGLTEILGNEIEEEKANNLEIDQDLIDIQNKIVKVFKIHEENGLGVVKLTRKHGDELIEIEFDVQNVDEDTPMNEVENEDDNEDEEGSGIGINFTITIKRGKNTMVVDSLATDSFTIQNIRYIDEKHASTEPNELYEGPSFNDLDENLQGAFYEYLTERNIDDDLSFFVLAYSRDKEQREYTHWLEKVQAFTASK